MTLLVLVSDDSCFLSSQLINNITAIRKRCVFMLQKFGLKLIYRNEMKTLSLCQQSTSPATRSAIMGVRATPIPLQATAR